MCAGRGVRCVIAGSRNRVDCSANLVSKQTIEMMCNTNLPSRGVYWHISPAHCIPHNGFHGVMRVRICGMYGMTDSAVAATSKAPAVVARTLLQPLLNVAWLAAKNTLSCVAERIVLLLDKGCTLVLHLLQ